jgi:2-dehydropantoate 2-reductase
MTPGLAHAIKSVYLIGLGAVGSMVASKIHGKAPENLHVIVDSNRYERYMEAGVQVNGETMDFHYAITAENLPPADLIIVSVKQNHLMQAIEEMKPFVSENTVILSLLNGVTSEQILGDSFGHEKMVYGFIVGTDAERKGTAANFTKTGRIVFNEKTSTELSERVHAINAFLGDCEFPTENPQNIIHEQWWKFMLNVGLNQVSAILRAPYGSFIKYDDIRELFIMAAREVMLVSKYEGVNLQEEDLARCLKVMATLTENGKCSMFQDVEAKRETEVEIFGGAVVQFGQKHGVSTPVNEVLYRLIKANTLLQ